MIVARNAPFSITIADDDPDDRALFRELFEGDRRFKVIGCLVSGIEVFDEISRKKNVTEILLVDMYMPHFTGVEVVKALNELDAAPNMYKFVISSTVNILENEPQLDSPYIIFLRKPANMQEVYHLPNIILDYLSKRVERVS